MKIFYSVLIWLSLLSVLFSNLVTIATSRDQFLAAKLVDHPNQWSLSLKEDSYLEERFAEEDAADLLATFLKSHANSEYQFIGAITAAGLCVLIFSAIGYWREKKNENPGKPE